MIITDYCMPGMTGYDELLKKIKESSTFKEIPVVIMSTENILSRIDRCLEEGAEEFIVKPIKLSDVKRLKHYLTREGENESRWSHKRKLQDAVPSSTSPSTLSLPPSSSSFLSVPSSPESPSMRAQDPVSKSRQEPVSPNPLEPSKDRRSRVLEGHLPVYVAEEIKRFIISVEFFNHPIFVLLLKKSIQEYKCDQKGVLRIPCHILVFEWVLEALCVVGDSERDPKELVHSLSDDFL
uniref:Response regulatory domain-containing protein n=1 Tax=Nelumbo nucifera TaxID=4432 RepID=A0A822YT36_NELNU|nr:TPA_asm: hypothetical protein HUJ06_005361 [Nelumbo nucifera]